ncbi:MAG: zinc-binding dehydrogenase [Pelobium sp.]
MQALVLNGVDQPFQLKEVPKPVLKIGEVLVKIKAAAFNRRDYWITKGQYAGLKFPIILGSDGSGIVAEVFDKTEEHWINQEVVIHPGNNWGDNPNFQGAEFKILGLPDNGTFAEFVKVNVKNVHPKPAHLNFEQAAAFPLAGLTAYRALFTKAALQKSDKVLIVGVGGGAATFALQWALAFGADVYVTSSSEEKIKKAVELGAKGGVKYTTENWDQQLKELSNGIDVIIDSAVGEGFAKHLTYINAGGRIVFFGATAGNIPELNSRIIFWKQLQILGTTMGTDAEFKAMLHFISQHQIMPLIDQVFSFEEANEAISLMKNSSQFGKIVLTR